MQKNPFFAWYIVVFLINNLKEFTFHFRNVKLFLEQAA
jgi:hypothetical protein